MVFAAGLGTRLRPYTNDRPKALVELRGKTLLEIVLRRLQSFGVNEVVVNVHHFADMVEEHLQRYEKQLALTIHISDEREQLLETGGGLLKAKPWLADAPFLLHNVDIISDLDLRDIYQQHQQEQVLTTLAVRQRHTSRYLTFNDQHELCGWRNNKTGEVRSSRLTASLTSWAYSGMAVIDPGLWAYFPDEIHPFSIIDVWLAAAKDGIIKAYPHDHTSWLDVGKPHTLDQAANLIHDDQ